jgi:hypothetical protein
VSLEHELCLSRARVPELDATVLGTREHPFGIGRKGDTKHEILCRVSVTVNR